MNKELQHKFSFICADLFDWSLSSILRENKKDIEWLVRVIEMSCNIEITHIEACVFWYYLNNGSWSIIFEDAIMTQDLMPGMINGFIKYYETTKEDGE